MFGALATGMMACSNDDTPKGGNGNGAISGDGYLAVNIQLPTETATRGTNDLFDDGLDNEYAVKNGVILLFTGTGDSDAVYQAAYSIPLNPVSPGDDQITTSYKQAITVNDFTIDDDKSIYGLVLLNYNNVVDVTTNTDGSCTVKFGENTLESGATTFTDIQGYKSSVTDAKASNPYIYINGDNEYFFMSNTVLSSNEGGQINPSSGDLYTLAYLGQKLYDTEAEALQAANDIFVERGLAKVTMTSVENLKAEFTFTEGSNATNSNGTPETADAEAQTVSFTVEGFKLGNLEYSSFPVRKMLKKYLGYNSNVTGTETSQKYRFVSANDMGNTILTPSQQAKPVYRNYWAEDPTYENTRAFNYSYTNYSPGEQTNKSNPLYCFENTFKVENQDYNNSTRAVIKVKFNGGNTFFIINGDKETYYTEENAKSYVTKYISDNTGLRKQIEDALKNTTSTTAEDGTTETVVDYANFFTVTYKDMNSVNNSVEVSAITPKDITLPDGKTEFDDISELIKEVNQFVKLTKYVDGYAYYPVIIKHFGDKLTPWEKENGTDAVTTTAQAYGNGEDANNKYLGRYGMVRNNWYEINVTKILQLGEAADPSTGTIKNLPDDNREVEKWIAFKVNVLKWAKRTDDYILK